MASFLPPPLRMKINVFFPGLIIFIFGIAPGLVMGLEIPKNPKETSVGLEIGTWTLEPWGNPGSADTLTSGERKRLKLIYMGGEKEKSAYKHLTGSTADPEGKLRFHVYTPQDKPPKIAVGISTTQAYLWHESKAYPMKKGWNKIEISIGRSQWKTAKTKWIHKSPIEHIEQIRAVDILVFNGKNTGWLVVEGLEFDLDETAKRVLKLIEELKSSEPEKRAKAEKELVAIGRPAVAALMKVKNSKRPEVNMRAMWALEKINATKEKAPTDPEILTKVLKQKEGAVYTDALRRSQYLLQRLKKERKILNNLLEDATDEVARGSLEAQKLQYSTAEQKKVLADTLDELKKLSLELKKTLVKKSDDAEGEKSLPTKDAALPKTEPAAKTETTKPEAEKKVSDK